MTTSQEAAAVAAIKHYVLHDVALGIYDPIKPHRPKVEVISLEVEFLDYDEQDQILHAAGPIVLKGSHQHVELHLKISVTAQFQGDVLVIPEYPTVRASYVFTTNHPTGACREKAALEHIK